MTKVLIVLTGAKEWSLKDGSKHFGGVWSPEFVYPHDRFSKAGYEVVVATLGGAPAPVDPASLSLGLQENDQTSVDFQRDYLRRPEIEAALARPARLEVLDPEEFDVIFVPGGFGVFEDLGGNAVIGRMIAKACRQDGKIVGALCSGVSALLGARADDGSWPFAGKRLTGFPTTEMADFGVAQMLLAHRQQPSFFADAAPRSPNCKRGFDRALALYDPAKHRATTDRDRARNRR